MGAKSVNWPLKYDADVGPGVKLVMHYPSIGVGSGQLANLRPPIQPLAKALGLLAVRKKKISLRQRDCQEKPIFGGDAIAGLAGGISWGLTGAENVREIHRKSKIFFLSALPRAPRLLQATVPLEFSLFSNKVMHHNISNRNPQHHFI